MIVGIDGENEKLAFEFSKKISTYLNWSLIYPVKKENFQKKYSLKENSIFSTITLTLEKFKRIEDGFELLSSKSNKGVVIPFSPFKEFFDTYRLRSEKEIELFNFYFFTFLEKFKTPDFFIFIYKSEGDDFYNFVKNFSMKFKVRSKLIPEYGILNGEISHKDVVKSFFKAKGIYIDEDFK